MTEIQKKLMTLMDEIDAICQKEGLQYALANRTAARAAEYGEFLNEAYDFYIIMPVPDALKLQEYVRANNIPDREFESWEDNGALRRMMFRYVDKGSLLIDGSSGNYFKKPGIAITILAAKTRKSNIKINGCERYLQILNGGGANKKGFWIPVTIAKIFTKLLGMKRAKKLLRMPKLEAYVENTGGLHWGGLKAIFKSRDNMAKRLMEYHSSGESVQGYWYMTWERKMVKLPDTFFSDAERIDFEGRKFPVTSDLPGYLKKIFGDKWRSTYLKSFPEANRIRVIAECDLPYEDYLSYIDGKGVSMEWIMQDKRDYDRWMRLVHNPMEKKVNHTFRRVKRSVDRIDVWYRLKKKRQEIKAAYEKKDAEKLSELLSEYLKKTDEYFAEGIGFYIDDELFECAKLVWESEDKPQYAEKVYDKVPELYKNESVDEYFAKRAREK